MYSYLLLLEINFPYFNSIVLASYKLIIAGIEKFDLMNIVRPSSIPTNRLPTGDIPDNQVVVLLPTERGQVLVIIGEAETLNGELVNGQPVHQTASLEIPDDNVGFKA